MTKKDLLDIANTLTADEDEINVFELAARDGYYILEAFTRETLEQLGFDLTNVSDDTLSKIARKSEVDTISLMSLCYGYFIPERSDP